jgi:hypothetical protein
MDLGERQIPERGGEIQGEERERGRGRERREREGER